VIIRSTIAIGSVLRANTVSVLRNFAGNPFGPGKCLDQIAHQLGFPDAAGVAADDDQSPQICRRYRSGSHVFIFSRVSLLKL
jgi:hypothetical protein